MMTLEERLRDFDTRFSAMAAKHNWTRKFGLAAIIEEGFSSAKVPYQIARGRDLFWVTRYYMHCEEQ